MDDAGHRLSCVLPAYNEADSLDATVTEWAAALARHASDYEIIVVDDGSTDTTAARLRDLRGRHSRLRVVTHARNLGYGAAIRDGFEAARFPLLFFTDSDGQYDPDDIGRVLERIDTADLVVGYRLGRSDPGIRRLLSRGYNLLVRRVIGVTLRDINCAFKLIQRDALRRIAIASTGFMINAELAVYARRAGMRVVEVAVRHRPRRAGRSSVRPVHVVSGLYGLAWLRRRQQRTLATPARLRTDPGFTEGRPSLPLEGSRDTAAPAG